MFVIAQVPPSRLLTEGEGNRAVLRASFPAMPEPTHVVEINGQGQPRVVYAAWQLDDAVVVLDTRTDIMMRELTGRLFPEYRLRLVDDVAYKALRPADAYVVQYRYHEPYMIGEFAEAISFNLVSTMALDMTATPAAYYSLSAEDRRLIRESVDPIMHSPSLVKAAPEAALRAMLRPLIERRNHYQWIAGLSGYLVMEYNDGVWATWATTNARKQPLRQLFALEACALAGSQHPTEQVNPREQDALHIS